MSSTSSTPIRRFIAIKSTSPARFLVEQLLFLFFQPIPTVLGLTLRAIVYRLLLKHRGLFAIEEDVVLCHSRNIALGTNAYVGRGSYLGASDGGVTLGNNACLMGQNYLNVFNFEVSERIGAKIVLEDDVVLSVGCTIHGHSGVRLGRGTVVGPRTVFVSGNHGTIGVRQNHRFAPIVRNLPIDIGENVWIGANVTILPGVTIGNNCIIGANSLVTESVPPDVVCAGSPARVLREIGSSIEPPK